MIVLVTGGARCGKSALSERFCMELGENRVYLAAMRPFGSEGEQRVRKHRAQRAGKGFLTIECFDGFERAVSDQRIVGATVLLECMGNVVANELFSEEAIQQEHSIGVSEKVHYCIEQVDAAMRMLEDRAGNAVIVGNEVGSDGFSYQRETREYQHALGALLCNLADRSDLVVECVAGEPIVFRQSETARSSEGIARALGWPNGGPRGPLA